MAGNSLIQKDILLLHDLSGNIATDPIPCNIQDNVGLQVFWIGSPIGSFGVQISNNYYPGDSVKAFNAGKWSDLEFGKTISASGASDDALFNLNNLPFSYWRLVYSFTSGSGLVTAVLTQKALSG